MASTTDEGAVPQPRLLTYSDLPVAAANSCEAFKNDPLFEYMYNTPDSSEKQRAIQHSAMKANNTISYAEYVHRGTAWTVEDGASVITYELAKGSDPGSSLDKLIKWMIPYLLSYKQFLKTKEQAKRSKEVQDKTLKAIEEVIGARKDSMMYLRDIMTAPEKQGRGYASTLVRIVTTKADEEKQSTWLKSSNKANVPFYNTFGFKTVKEVIIGNDNPTWDLPPVINDIMIREYEG